MRLQKGKIFHASAVWIIALAGILFWPAARQPLAKQSGSAPREIEGTWNRVTDAPLRITLKFGDNASLAYVKIDDNHELQTHHIYFDGEGPCADDKVCFWHAVEGDNEQEHWTYSCVEVEDGTDSAVELDCDTNFESGEVLYFRRRGN
jgi:hypothetical protein